jgi:hypothetical protein
LFSAAWAARIRTSKFSTSLRDPAPASCFARASFSSFSLKVMSARAIRMFSQASWTP